MEGITEIPFWLLIGGGLLAFVLVVAILRRLTAAVIVVMMMLFVAATGTQGSEFTGIRLWLYPIQAARSPIFLALGAILFVGVFAHAGRVQRTLPIQGAVLLAIALYAGLLRVVHESPMSGLSSIFMALVTITPILFVVPALVRDWDDYSNITRAILFANLVWLGAVFVQLVLDPGQLSLGRNSRFLGITGNPQHAAAFLGVMGVIALWQFLNEPQGRLRLLWIAIFGIDLILLVWTGSRTGAGMFLVGTVIATYGRLGRTALYLPIVFLALYGAYTVVGMLDVDLGSAQRLTSTEDTRSGAWLGLIENAMERPLIGLGVENAGDSENSYLYAFAAYGLGMLALIITLVGISFGYMLRLFWLRRELDADHRSMVDLVIAFNAMYFAGAVFEGYLIARVAAPLVLMLIFSALANRITRLAREDQAVREYDAYEGDDGYDADDAYDAYDEEWDDEAYAEVAY